MMVWIIVLRYFIHKIETTLVYLIVSEYRCEGVFILMDMNFGESATSFYFRIHSI